MLQELAAGSGTAGWAIASLIFFLVVWLVIAARVFRASPEELEARARLALEGDGEDGVRTPSGARTER
jgi:hypothetical protein